MNRGGCRGGDELWSGAGADLARSGSVLALVVVGLLADRLDSGEGERERAGLYSEMECRRLRLRAQTCLHTSFAVPRPLRLPLSAYIPNYFSASYQERSHTDYPPPSSAVQPYRQLNPAAHS